MPITPAQHYYVSALTTAVSAVILGTIVYYFATNRRLAKYFAWYTSTIALWSFFVFVSTATSDHRLAYLAAKICHVGSVLIPVAFLQFVRIYTRSESALMKKIIWFNYILVGPFLLSIVICPHLFIADVVPKLTFNFFPDPGPLFIVWSVLFVLQVITGTAFLAFQAKKKAGVERKRLIFFLVGNVIGYIGGGACFLPTYGVDFPPFPYGVWGVFFFTCLTAFSVLYYQFLNIEILAKRTLVFAGLLSFVFGVFALATVLVRDVFSVRLGLNNLWSYVISIFLMVLAYDPIRNFLINLTDRYFFQKKYNYQKVLKDASRGMSRIKSLDHLFRLVVHFITMKMRVRRTAILTRQAGRGGFMLRYQRGYEKKFLDRRLTASNPLIDYLDCEKEAVDIERLREYVESGGRKTFRGGFIRNYDYEAIKQEMEILGAHCCVPSFLGRELRNVLVLGEKKSGGFFTDEDLNVLFTLAQESAIAIENARLYDEAVRKTFELEQINKELEVAKDRLTVALRETEIANKQLKDTQAQLIHEQKMATLGRLAASVGHEVNNPLTILSMNVSRAILKARKNPELKVIEITELFDKMEQNIGRIKAVVNTLTGLLKRSEKGKFEPLSLKLILEETLPLVQFQTYLDNLSGTEVEFDVPSSLPLVRGDLERLQEVFLNLFINAYHAMTGNRKRLIQVWAEVDPADPHQLDIYFRDNGSGMPEEVMKRIFNYGFTTKEPGKGSGLGLYMCKYILELHGGDIKVASEVGKGTTFTIFLPIYRGEGQEQSLDTKQTGSG